jgi:hypothetical protein
MQNRWLSHLFSVARHVMADEMSQYCKLSCFMGLASDRFRRQLLMPSDISRYAGSHEAK